MSPQDRPRDLRLDLHRLVHSCVRFAENFLVYSVHSSGEGESYTRTRPFFQRECDQGQEPHVEISLPVSQISNQYKELFVRRHILKIQLFFYVIINIYNNILLHRFIILCHKSTQQTY